jgi:type II secretory pathway component PulF
MSALIITVSLPGAASVLCVVTPHYELYFQDFGTKLPAVTLLLIGWSHRFIAGGWIIVWLVPIGAGLLGPFLLPAKPAPWRHRVACIFIPCIVFMIAAGLWVAMALRMPTISIIRSISSGR